MKNWCVIIAATTGVLSGMTGCTPDRAPDRTGVPASQSTTLTTRGSDTGTVSMAGADPVVATVDGRPILRSQLYQPMVEAYGLGVLLNLVQLELAKQEALRAGLTVTEADIVAEREYTIHKLFPEAKPDEYDRAVEQLLQTQHITAADFAMTIRINTYLRRIVTPLIKDKITEPALKDAFGSMYGEQVQVRHIALSSMDRVATAQARLAAGEPFQKIAQEMSENPRSAAVGGELPPFTRNSTEIPAVFRDAAFALKPGEVSGIVMDGATRHLIKVERRVPPKAVKFEDVRESVKEDVEERLIQSGIRQLRTDFGQKALATLTITEPTLSKQYQDKIAERDAKIKDRDDVKKDLVKDREKEQAAQRAAATLPATGATIPGTTLPTTETSTSPFPPRGKVPDAPSTTGPTLFPREPATNPSAVPAALRPPATGSAAPAAADTPSTVPAKNPQ